MKLHVRLVQEDILKALEGESEFDKTMTENDRTLLLKKIHNRIILSFGVLRQILKEKYHKRITEKFESLYITKS